MKRTFSALVLTCALAHLPAAITARAYRDRLSEAARAFLPDQTIVDVRYRDGRELRAELVEETPEGYDLRVTVGAITSRRQVARAEVESVQQVGTAEFFANALRDFRLESQRSLPPERYRQALELFDEYLALFPATDDAGWIGERRDEFREEYDKVERGLRKIDGEWLAPVQAAIRQFNQVTHAMTQIERRHPGITRAQWSGDPAARASYNRLRDQRRAVARQVPQIMTERIPFLIDEARYDEAFLEMNAFMRFWIARVLETETAATDRAQFGRGVFEGMDFDYLLRLQRRIMEPYIAGRDAKRERAPEPLPPEMVYIPGGYFFMGNEQASPRDDNFPLRVVFVNPFLIDRYEVTNAEYREFYEYVRQTGDYSMSHPSAPPLKDHAAEGWKHPDFAGDRQPVVGVDWFDAFAYLRWRDKRMLTEAEWEFAARGRDGRLYPWGDAAPGRTYVNSPSGRRYIAAEMDRQLPPPPPPRQSRFGCRKQPPPPPEQTMTVLPARTWEVDSLLPREALTEDYDWEKIDPFKLNAFGIYHIAGNAAAWVADWYEGAYYTRIAWDNPTGPSEGNARVFRGGSYLSEDADLATFRRFRPTDTNMRRGLASDGRPITGIRGARDIPLAAGNNDMD